MLNLKKTCHWYGYFFPETVRLVVFICLIVLFCKCRKSPQRFQEDSGPEDRPLQRGLPPDKRVNGIFFAYQLNTGEEKRQKFYASFIEKKGNLFQSSYKYHTPSGSKVGDVSLKKVQVDTIKLIENLGSHNVWYSKTGSLLDTLLPLVWLTGSVATYPPLHIDVSDLWPMFYAEPIPTATASIHQPLIINSEYYTKDCDSIILVYNKGLYQKRLGATSGNKVLTVPRDLLEELGPSGKEDRFFIYLSKYSWMVHGGRVYVFEATRAKILNVILIN